MKKRLYYFAVALLALGFVLVACSPKQTAAPGAQTSKETKPGDLKFITVVKSVAFNWFKRMETGIQEFSKDTGVTAVMQGPSKADAALQLQVVEDAIAQKPNALLVVPFQPETLEPALKKAMDQGITVISHEASNAQNVKYDIEAFDNAAYGRHLMDELAKRMNYEGKYVVFVGSLTSTTHNEWVDAAIAWQKEKYPKMQLVGTKNETGDDTQKAYQIMKDLLKTYPDIKGVQGSSAVDVVGAGQAIEEAGLQDKIAVVGTSIPSYAGELLKTGAVDLITCWDPAKAGYVMNKVALMLLQGKKIEEGMDLGVPGYEKIRLVGKVIYGSAWVDIDKNNMDQYPF
ncbi:MAG: autoinducer 2 ABC transporter substrate-binding protein [Moorellaceae bacterium]